MRVINFLPDDYLQRRGQRRATLVCVAVAGGSLLVLGLVAAFLFVQAMSVGRVRAVVDRQYAEASRQIGQLKQLEERKSGLLHKVELSATLLERVPRSHLLARLTNYLPAETSLTSITMRVEQIEVKVEAPAAGDDKKKPGAAKSAKPEPTTSAAGSSRKGGNRAAANTVRVKQVVFRVDGLAETDVQVAEYINLLNADPLFSEVDLQFSEEFPYQPGVMKRRFQLVFRLSKQAEAVLETLTAQAPAAAPAKEPAKGAS